MSVAAERVLDELKRGRAVLIGGADGLAVLSVELATEEALSLFDGDGRADLLITDKRAQSLNLANQRPAAGMRAVRLARPDWIDAAGSVAVADPVLDLSSPLKGPFSTRPVGDDSLAAAALQAAKLAGLLPALHVRAARPADAELLSVPAAEIMSLRAPETLREIGRAKLPVKGAEDGRVVAFRSPGGPEHLALLVGRWDRGTPLTRLHSACLTGDVLGSLKCDCGDQLHAAVAAMTEAGGGILLYLQQEGRGIGLINKLRAYALQDQGYDTVDANLRLGFEIDERDFGIAAAMLKMLGVSSIRLLTNNPGKVSGLSALGIDVTERVPLVAGHGPLNEGYLATKRDRTGHQF
ncbi:GTP cyclohydrolase II [Pacificimonas flava]|uniref:GTP cyclohydrolase-2 n=2 Tax=Pacificimonas TaxID=1960290 RepID=A0A219B395_9SPHN|nr:MULTISPECIES: GTP cyclohydrolase II [Pacificimonas]MBZ6377536.1 GTP cyclohydrolase II [Pacificimonas aurantium]OWV32771.1 GTP cyclohydrolase II [Pacificimonas flava]